MVFLQTSAEETYTLLSSSAEVTPARTVEALTAMEGGGGGIWNPSRAAVQWRAVISLRVGVSVRRAVAGEESEETRRNCWLKQSWRCLWFGYLFQKSGDTGRAERTGVFKGV